MKCRTRKGSSEKKENFTSKKEYWITAHIVLLFFRSVQRKERKHGRVYSPLLRLNSMINNVILSRQSPVLYHELYNTKKYIYIIEYLIATYESGYYIYILTSNDSYTCKKEQKWLRALKIFEKKEKVLTLIVFFL
jgi:hypothetical protein